MLYSILLPIIVILSFIGVIVFLFRKASRVADLRDERTRVIRELDGEKKGPSKGIFSRACSTVCSKSKIWLWTFLERMTRRFRIIFLKLESSFNRTSSRLRERKNNNKKVELEKDREKESEAVEKSKEEDSYDFSYLRKKSHEKLSKITDREVFAEDMDEKPIKPMISEKVVSPRSRSEIKDIFEDVLIERIAANPKDIEAYERLGEYYMEIGNYDHAKECIKQVIRLDPANRNAKYKMKRLERLLHG